MQDEGSFLNSHAMLKLLVGFILKKCGHEPIWWANAKYIDRILNLNDDFGGVVCASITQGFGELTFLGLSAHFDK